MRFVWDYTYPDFLRFWLHFPIGAGGACLVFLEPTVGIIFNLYFIVYEAFNDWRKKDQSYKDIIGAVAGYAAGSAIWLICRLI